MDSAMGCQIGGLRFVVLRMDVFNFTPLENFSGHPKKCHEVPPWRRDEAQLSSEMGSLVGGSWAGVSLIRAACMTLCLRP